MKINKQQLQRIIKEEVRRAKRRLAEGHGGMSYGGRDEGGYGKRDGMAYGGRDVSHKRLDPREFDMDYPSEMSGREFEQRAAVEEEIADILRKHDDAGELQLAFARLQEEYPGQEVNLDELIGQFLDND